MQVGGEEKAGREVLAWSMGLMLGTVFGPGVQLQSAEARPLLRTSFVCPKTRMQHENLGASAFLDNKSKTAVADQEYPDSLPAEMLERRSEVVERMRDLDEKAAPIIQFLQDPSHVDQLHPSDKAYNVQLLRERFNVSATLLSFAYLLSSILHR